MKRIPGKVEYIAYFRVSLLKCNNDRNLNVSQKTMLTIDRYTSSTAGTTVSQKTMLTIDRHMSSTAGTNVSQKTMLTIDRYISSTARTLLGRKLC